MSKFNPAQIGQMQENQQILLNAVSLAMGALDGIVKTEVGLDGQIAMRHIAETALVKIHKIAQGESLESELRITNYELRGEKNA